MHCTSFIHHAGRDSYTELLRSSGCSTRTATLFSHAGSTKEYEGERLEVTKSLLVEMFLVFQFVDSLVQWNLTNPNSLGPELVQISEIFGLMKQYI